jgi:hypothetical protein
LARPFVLTAAGPDFFDFGIADEYRLPVSSSDPNMSALGATSKISAHIPLDIVHEQSISEANEGRR